MRDRLKCFFKGSFSENFHIKWELKKYFGSLFLYLWNTVDVFDVYAASVNKLHNNIFSWNAVNWFANILSTHIFILAVFHLLVYGVFPMQILQQRNIFTLQWTILCLTKCSRVKRLLWDSYIVSIQYKCIGANYAGVS